LTAEAVASDDFGRPHRSATATEPATCGGVNENEEVTMAAYVDGFVIPVPEAKLDDYMDMARESGKLWREHGALEFRECVADDVKVGEVTSFPRSVQVEDGETVVFSWIVFSSREERDRVNAAVMQDPRFEELTKREMPFDGKRMIYGGFDMSVEA
jgi:uncharacterized protein YbaA (DUF1428 family)